MPSAHLMGRRMRSFTITKELILRWCRRGAFYRLPKFLSRHSLTKAVNYRVTTKSQSFPYSAGDSQTATILIRPFRAVVTCNCAFRCRQLASAFLIERPGRSDYDLRRFPPIITTNASANQPRPTLSRKGTSSVLAYEPLGV